MEVQKPTTIFNLVYNLPTIKLGYILKIGQQGYSLEGLLGFFVFLLGGLAIPVGGLFEVLFYTLAECVAFA